MRRTSTWADTITGLSTLNNSGAYPNSNYNHNIDAFIQSTEYRNRFGQP